MSRKRVPLNQNECTDDFRIGVPFEQNLHAEVCLNDDESQNNLKSIFVKLLVQLTKHPVELQFLENPEYKTGLYIDVCKEYIKDLNKEIASVRKNMPEKLKVS